MSALGTRVQICDTSNPIKDFDVVVLYINKPINLYAAEGEKVFAMLAIENVVLFFCMM